MTKTGNEMDITLLLMKSIKLPKLYTVTKAIHNNNFIGFMKNQNDLLLQKPSFEVGQTLFYKFIVCIFIIRWISFAYCELKCGSTDYLKIQMLPITSGSRYNVK